MTTEPVFKNPSAYNWNISIEREVGFATTVSVAYVGRVGLHLERTRDLNQPALGATQDPANRGVNIDVLRPYKGFAPIDMREMATRSKYNGLQIDVNRRVTRRLSFGGAAPILDNQQKQRIIAMVYSGPPTGFARWTVRLIAEEAVKRRLVPRG